jgi:hypothetical protein
MLEPQMFLLPLISFPFIALLIALLPELLFLLFILFMDLSIGLVL